MIDGPTLLADALRAGVVVEEVFTAGGHDAVVDAAAASGAAVREVAAAALAGATDPVTSPGVAAVAVRIERPLAEVLAAAAAGPLALVLVDVADPGNAGTLVRAAEAAGASAVLFCGRSVDPSSSKCVRSSAGALFHVPVAIEGEGGAVLERLGELQVRRVATVVDDGTPYDRADLTGPVALVLGNEAHGLTTDVLEAVDERVTIPLAGRSQSLNVAMAGSVLCFESLRQRRSPR